jgi:hypothetical protein
MKKNNPAQHVLLFGDQTTQVLTPIRHLIGSSKSSLYLKVFLSKATDKIRSLTFSLIGHGGRRLQDFTDLETLAEGVSEKTSCFDDLVLGILLYVVRIGRLILSSAPKYVVL